LTKKHGLTITSSALQKLAVFIGRNCGSKWREGLAEAVLGFVAQHCKDTGRMIIDGPDDEKYLGSIFKELAGRMKGGRITQESTIDGPIPTRGVVKAADAAAISSDPRSHLNVVHARDQPRLVYNVGKKHFDRIATKPSLLPNPASKTLLFRNRYNIIHQRLLRNEAFQIPTMNRVPTLHRSSSSMITAQQTYRLTPIANLLGRSGTPHLLLGLLTISPTGTLALSDLTGSIALDLTHAQVSPPDAAWFVPGMIVLIDGIYEDEELTSGSGLGGGGGIGGTIGGKFIGTTVGTPLAEKRHVTLGTTGEDDDDGAVAGGGFGWVDFLGLGSAREKDNSMRELQARIFMPPPALPTQISSDSQTQLDTSQVQPAESQSQPLPTPAPRSHMAILGDLTLDIPQTLSALMKVLSLYAALPASSLPISFILLGPFISVPAFTLAGTGGVEYKELFDSLAAVLANFPVLLANCTFVFVPGDNDAWGSSFSAGAAGVLPLEAVPKWFTSRITKAFAAANSEARKEAGAAGTTRVDGEAIWTSNPSRLCLFGPTHEIVLFRDDISSRFRRHAIRTAAAPGRSQEDIDLADEPPEDEDPTTHAARKLTKTLLDQGHLCPFRLADRPVLWDYASALQLYPLPTALVVCDAEAGAFVERYEGCCVLNPGRVAVESGVGGRRTARWVEYDVNERMGRVREVGY
jgi:DNA polymerase epsilon subunit 2